MALDPPPCVPLHRVCAGRGGRVVVKLEQRSPSGSLQDRLALPWWERAVREGTLASGRPAAAASAGDFGVSLALAGLRLGYELDVYLPESASLERRALLRQLGVRLTLTPGETWLEGAWQAVRDAAAAPDGPVPLGLDAAFSARVLQSTVGMELADALAGAGKTVAGFVCGRGSGATLVGVGAALKGRFPAMKAWPVEVGGRPHPIQGLDWSSAPLGAPWLESPIAVSIEAVLDMRRRLAREEGLSVSLSSAANVLGAVRMAQQVPEDAVVATVLWASGEREFSLEREASREALGARP